MKYILSFLIALFFIPGMKGQEKHTDGIYATGVTFSKTETNQLDVQASIHLDRKFRLTTNRGATLTPVLRKGEYTKILSTILIYGRERGIISRRKDRIPADAQTVIQRQNRTHQEIPFQATVDYQSWMDQAELVLIEDLCGCGNHIEEHYETLLATVPALSSDINVEEPKPSDIAELHPVQPESKIPATRLTPARRIKTIEGKANLCFPVNEIIIYPEYMQNPAELQKICATIETVDIKDITRIYLHGYASPEGSRANNLRLAGGRVAALETYLVDKYKFDPAMIITQFTAEDWEGFRQQIVASDLAEKQAILDIIDSKDYEDGKEQRLKRLGMPLYKRILKEFFPHLRHTDYKIEYIENVEPKSDTVQ